MQLTDEIKDTASKFIKKNAKIQMLYGKETMVLKVAQGYNCIVQPRFIGDKLYLPNGTAQLYEYAIRSKSRIISRKTHRGHPETAMEEALNTMLTYLNEQIREFKQIESTLQDENLI